MLDEAQRRFVARARTATLATVAPDGRPRLVPICHVLDDDGQGRPVVYSPLDEKPKSVADPRRLARVRDLRASPRVTVLVHHWSEDWGELGWVRLDGRGELIEPGQGRPDASGSREHARAVSALRTKYPQYAHHDLEARPIIRIVVDRATRWGRVDGPA